MDAEGTSTALQASALDLPFETGSFEVVVSIGCLHHTGNVPRAISEVHRVLAAGGTALIMLYNRHSLRHLAVVNKARLRHVARRGSDADAAYLRGKYDSN